MEMKDNLELSENVLLGLQRIQADLPELQKLKEESSKNLSAIEIKTKNFKDVLDEAEKKSKDLSATVSEIKRVSQDGLSQIKTESSNTLEKLKKSINEDKLNQFEEKLEQIEKLVDEHAGIFDMLMQKIKAMDAKTAELEGRLKNVSQEKMTQVAAVTSGTSDVIRIPEELPSFPENARSFSLDNIKSVKSLRSTKPCEIVFDEEVRECSSWTDMLKSVIKYGFDNYEISIDDLCNQEYRVENHDGEFVPYFVSGRAPSKKYTYIEELNLSVYFSGANRMVDVIHDFLCDYIGIEENKVTVFYHDK